MTGRIQRIPELNGTEPCQFGVSSSSRRPLPMQNVSINAEVTNWTANVKTTFSLSNNSDNPTEVMFNFDIPRAHLYYFEVKRDGKTFIGVCKEKNEAAEDYDDAIASGNSAYLAEKISDTGMRLNVGNLQPKDKCEVTIVYVQELLSASNWVEFILPITSRIPSTKESNVTVTFTTSHPIIAIESNSHDKLDIQNDKKTLHLNGQDLHNRQLNIFFRTEKMHEPSLVFEESPIDKNRVAMLSFYPHIEDTEIADTCEIIFVVDRSGSMSGSRMKSAKCALQLFLRALPETALFNIVSFGTDFSSLFNSSVPYSEDSFKKAKDHVESMNASFGGTDILKPLNHILKQKSDPSVPRQIFFLTDGEDSNEKEIISTLKSNIGTSTRVFPFGIGAEASVDLLKKMGSIGRGRVELAKNDMNLSSKVMRQMSDALKPTLKDVMINWGGKKQLYPVLFHGERIVSYNTIKEGENNQSIKITATVANKPWRFEVKALDNVTIKGSSIHRLSAIQYINKTEDEDVVIELAKKWNLVTKSTSLVVIEKREQVKAQAEMKTITEGVSQQDVYSNSEDTIKQRNIVIANIEMQVKEINEIFNDINCVVVAQGSQIDRIEADIDCSNCKVASAVTELKAAHEYQRRGILSRVVSWFWNPSPVGSQQSSSPSSSSFSRSSIANTPTPTTRLELVSAICNLQNASGFFVVSKEFETLLKLDKKRLTVGLNSARIDVVHVHLLTTLFVIAYLKKHFTQFEDMWSLLAKKAQRAVTKELTLKNLLRIEKKLDAIVTDLIAKSTLVI